MMTIVKKRPGKKTTAPGKKTRLQTLAKKLYGGKTRDAAEHILSEMMDVSNRGRAFPDEYIEETYLGLRDDHDYPREMNGGRTTMSEVRQLAKHYMKG